jgi:hypothetical protein
VALISTLASLTPKAAKNAIYLQVFLNEPVKGGFVCSNEPNKSKKLKAESGI